MTLRTQTDAQPAEWGPALCTGRGVIQQIVSTGVCFFLAGACLLAGVGSHTVRAQGMTLDICPSDYSSFPEDAPALTCGCDSASVKKGSVYGANPYYLLADVITGRRRCAARRFMPARSVRRADRSWSSPRRRRFFQRFRATAWREVPMVRGEAFRWWSPDNRRRLPLQALPAQVHRRRRA
jgi:hypothetical protein